MSVTLQSTRLLRPAQLGASSTSTALHSATSDLSLRLSSLCLHHRHPYSSDPPSRRGSTPSKGTSVYSSKDLPPTAYFDRMHKQAKPAHLRKAPEQLAQAAADRAKAKLQSQKDEHAKNLKLGGLADNSLFADEEPQKELPPGVTTADAAIQPSITDPLSLDDRDPNNLAVVLNPRPNARSRWQRRMVIRAVRHRGRLTKAMKIARSERSSLSKSHFFKTSMKKLAPLARQIAGKPIDQAILQMRFSPKKAAKEVHKHLIQARDEAIVGRGMGLGHLHSKVNGDGPAPPTSLAEDPASSLPLPHQTPSKSNKPGHRPHETDIYVSQAWVNRGPYGREPDYRAMGRMYIMRPPHTGLSVLLKEEKTRTREKAEKEAKAIRRRMGKNMWTQLPDRPIMRQQQQILW